MNTIMGVTLTVSERKRAANRRNGAKSTGPKTVRGKANACRNAATVKIAQRSHQVIVRQLLKKYNEPTRNPNQPTESHFQPTFAWSLCQVRPEVSPRPPRFRFRRDHLTLLPPFDIFFPATPLINGPIQSYI
jgi:hypothetical protein